MLVELFVKFAGAWNNYLVEQLVHDESTFLVDFQHLRSMAQGVGQMCRAAGIVIVFNGFSTAQQRKTAIELPQRFSVTRVGACHDDGNGELVFERIVLDQL